MLERTNPHAKLLPMLAADGRLAEALAGGWGALAETLRNRFGLTTAQQESLRLEGLATLREWSERHGEGKPPRRVLQQWLVSLRQDLSLEEVLLVLVHLDRALRQAGWQLGLSAPDWLALSELLSGFFEALLEEASAGWQGLLAQNHQLRDELAYFHRLAESREAGRDLGEHLNLAVRETARLLHCEFCAILLPREGERDVLEIRAAVAPRILSNALEGMSFPLAENGLIAQVFLTGAPASTYQALDDLEITMRRRQTLESLGFSQLMAYPLQTHGRVLGVLCVANRLDDQPWQALEEEWLSTVAGQLSASIRLSQLSGRHEASESELSAMLAAALALYDPHLALHGESVGTLARQIGAMLGLAGSRLEQLELAGRVHDLGMLALPQRLRAHPGPLWPAEAELVRTHPARAAEALRPLKHLDALLPAIRHHHERWDGTGYPEGLKGQAIPLEARIVAVADAYATLLTPQTYQPALTPADALAELQAHAGSQFDGLVVQALVEVLRQEGNLTLPGAEPAAPPVPPATPAALLEDVPRLLGLLAQLVATPAESGFYENFFEALARNCALEAGAVWRAADGVRLTLARAYGLEEPRDAEETGLEAYAAACRFPVTTADLGVDARFNGKALARRERLKTAVALPLVAADRLLGVLTVYRRTPAPFSPAEQAVLELAAGMLAQGLSFQDWHTRVEEPLSYDALTGLATHRAFLERLGAELKRGERYELPMSVVLLDLDEFAAYNEANGYGLGDEVLRQAAALLRGQLGPADLLARFEGDAFALLLAECGPQQAMETAEQLRLVLAASQFPSRHAGGARLTASLGVTTAHGTSDRRALLADAREALRRARQEGANRLLFHARAHEEA